MRDNTITNLKKKNRTSYNVLEELEEERRRIARELHDSTIQMLTMLIYKTELCEKLVEKDTIRTKMELEIMRQVLRESIDDLRNTIYNLHPMLIDDLGLTASVERYLITLRRDSLITFTLQVEGEEMKLIPILSLCCYRVIQECCSNIVKHSKASKASITITYAKTDIQIHIYDNGIGIDKVHIENGSTNITANDNEKACSKSNGFGIPMMKERITMLNGRFQYKTSNDGTHVNVGFPLVTCKEDTDE